MWIPDAILDLVVNRARSVSENLNFIYLQIVLVILKMPQTRKKSPVTQGKRKTRASDKASTSPKKHRKNKSSVSVNDGSYLQLQDQVAVSTVPSTTQNFISVSTGQMILEMLNKIDASNQELSKRMDRVERAGSVSSTPITSPTVLSTNNQKGLTATQQAAASHQPLPHRVNLV